MLSGKLLLPWPPPPVLRHLGRTQSMWTKKGGWGCGSDVKLRECGSGVRGAMLPAGNAARPGKANPWTSGAPHPPTGPSLATHCACRRSGSWGAPAPCRSDRCSSAGVARRVAAGRRGAAGPSSPPQGRLGSQTQLLSARRGSRPAVVWPWRSGGSAEARRRRHSSYLPRRSHPARSRSSPGGGPDLPRRAPSVCKQNRRCLSSELQLTRRWEGVCSAPKLGAPSRTSTPLCRSHVRPALPACLPASLPDSVLRSLFGPAAPSAAQHLLQLHEPSGSGSGVVGQLEAPTMPGEGSERTDAPPRRSCSCQKVAASQPALRAQEQPGPAPP